MEQNQILEGNRFIAEFMNVKTVNNTCELCGKDVTAEWLCTGNELGFTRSHALGGIIIPLAYHSSWNWLMPVVEKISRMVVELDSDGKPVGTYYPRTFGMIQQDTGLPMVRINCCPVYVGGTLIEAAWIAVVEFIKAEIQNVSPLVN